MYKGVIPSNLMHWEYPIEGYSYQTMCGPFPTLDLNICHAMA